MVTQVHNIVFRAVFALCAAAFVLATLPHHHHDNSEAVCFNPMHCFAHSDDHSDCCDHHDHCSTPANSTDEHSSCHLKIDVAEVISQLSKQSLLPPVQLHALIIEPLETVAMIAQEDTQRVDRHVLLPDPAQRIVRYIARALPTRAATERA